MECKHEPMLYEQAGPRAAERSQPPVVALILTGVNIGDGLKAPTGVVFICKHCRLLYYAEGKAVGGKVYAGGSFHGG